MMRFPPWRSRPMMPRTPYQWSKWARKFAITTPRSNCGPMSKELAARFRVTATALAENIR
ncbi:hypothetical protein CBG03_09005 [Streptococcus pyogenes]|nr:hypothetical protein CBG03_09005 [Streptococcus pyogenes]